MNNYLNRVRIKAVYHRLSELKHRVVFVGGTTLSFYADNPSLEVRPTNDVDVIIELLHYRDHTALEEKLRSIGFEHDRSSNVICRYTIAGITVDIIPTTASVIGFSNYWYEEGFKKAIDYCLDEQVTIKILSPPYFIASKLEAFKSRGGGDGRLSEDFEDIIYIFENRTRIWEELHQTTGEIRNYLKNTFKHLRQNPHIYEWIDAHVEWGMNTATADILRELDGFIQLG